MNKWTCLAPFVDLDTGEITGVCEEHSPAEDTHCCGCGAERNGPSWPGGCADELQRPRDPLHPAEYHDE